MANLPDGMNAWIFLNEDEPPGTNYNSSNSCFQSLINYKVYNSVTFLGIAFFLQKRDGEFLVVHHDCA